MSYTKINKKTLFGYLLIFSAMLFSIVNYFNLLNFFSDTNRLIFNFIGIAILFSLMTLSLYYNSEHRYKKYFLMAEFFLLFIGLPVSLLIEKFTLLMITICSLVFLFLINMIVNRFLPRQDNLVKDK